MCVCVCVKERERERESVSVMRCECQLRGMFSGFCEGSRSCIYWLVSLAGLQLLSTKIFIYFQRFWYFSDEQILLHSNQCEFRMKPNPRVNVMFVHFVYLNITIWNNYQLIKSKRQSFQTLFNNSFFCCLNWALWTNNNLWLNIFLFHKGQI